METGQADQGRGHGRWESPCAPETAGSRERKLVGISSEVARARVAVLGWKTERVPTQARIGLLVLRLPVPMLSRFSLVPVTLAPPLAGSRTSLLFIHGDPLGSEGAKPVVQAMERMTLWSSGQDPETLYCIDVLEPQYPQLGVVDTKTLLASLPVCLCEVVGGPDNH